MNFGFQSSCGVKRGKSCNSKDEEKPKEVVHVRARRGQATDSHSLAERVCIKFLKLNKYSDLIFNFMQCII